MNDFEFVWKLQNGDGELYNYIRDDVQKLLEEYQNLSITKPTHLAETTEIVEKAAKAFLEREKRYYGLAKANRTELTVLDTKIDDVLKKIAQPSERHGLKCLQVPPKFISLNGFEFGGFYGPKGNGNYYSGDADGVKLAGQDFILYTLDASGKSGPSDIVGKFALDAKVNLIVKSGELTEPHELFSYVNNIIYPLNERHGGEKMVTALCVKVLAPQSESETVNIEYCNAGHEPGLIFRVHDYKFDRLENEAKNLPLGIFGDSCYSKSRSHLNKGDVLILYTDGLLDAKSRKNKNERFGIERLRTIIMNSADIHPQELTRKIIESIRTFSGEGNKTDDLAILVMKYVGVPSHTI